MSGCCSKKQCGGATEKTPLLQDDSPKVTVDVKAGGVMQLKVALQNMCCEMEVELVEQALTDFDGVVSFKVNYLGKYVSVRYDDSVTSPMALVMRLNDYNLGASIKAATQGQTERESLTTWCCGIAGMKLWSIQSVCLIASFWVGRGVLYGIIALGLFDLAYAVWMKFRILGIRGLATMHTLMLSAALGAVALGNLNEATALLLLYSSSRILQETVLAHTRRQVERCAASAAFPNTATLASGESVNLESLKVGDVVVVRAGESIPTDGAVVAGGGHVDEALITGESLPVKKPKGASVLSGSILLDGTLDVKVTTVASESSAGQIQEMVAEAASGKTERDTRVEQFASRYTVAILLGALWYAGTGVVHQDMQAIHSALVLLVLGCPCALIAAGPIVTTCGITSLLSKGVFVKTAAVLDGLRFVTRVGLDKTGTLTQGKFAVDAQWKGDKWRPEYEKMIVALETRSAHPLAAAVVNSHAGCMTTAVNALGTSLDLPTVMKYHSHDGKGVSGTVDGHSCAAGSQPFIASLLPSNAFPASLHEFLASHRQHSLVFGTVDSEVVVCYALFDNVRSNAVEVVTDLKVLGVVPAIISGDRKGAVEAIAATVGIKDYNGQLLPAQKVAQVQAWQTAGERVMMVGDGINDAPALAAADCSVAMGAGGTALASHAASMVCADDNLASLPLAVRFSQRCNTIVTQNLVLALGPKLAVMALTLSGIFQPPLWVAVLADTGCLLAVLLNGTRVLFW